MDENLRFSYFSDLFSEITGVAEELLLGKTREETGIPNVDAEAWRQHTEDLAAHRPFRDFVHPRTNENGEILWLSINGTPVFDAAGAFKGYRGTGSDITEQKRIEYLLRESEQRLQAIMDHVPAALFLKDTEARYLLINRQFQEWFGIDPATVIGKNANDLFPKERADRYVEGDRKILGNWQVTKDEVVIPGPTGEDRSYELTKFPIFNAGEPTGFGGVMIDITERTQANRDLQKSENRAEMANRAKSEFLANMSHELRTPLNAIIGFSEIIKSGMLGQDSNGKNLEYASDIFESGQHLLDLINDILDISKIELGSEEPNDIEIMVPRLIDSIMVLMRERARVAKVHLQTNFHGELSFLRADERKLKQILINLLSNSIKFTHPGGQITLDVRCHLETGYEFVVSDSGIGIASEDIAKALQPFGQIDSNLNRKYTGTGLGLPLATELAEMHGGTLDISSKPGVGTTVTVRFPVERNITLMHGEAMPPTPHGWSN
jgi:PAS domain S-box-containing protein